MLNRADCRLHILRLYTLFSLFHEASIRQEGNISTRAGKSSHGCYLHVSIFTLSSLQSECCEVFLQSGTLYTHTHTQQEVLD